MKVDFPLFIIRDGKEGCQGLELKVDQKCHPLYI